MPKLCPLCEKELFVKEIGVLRVFECRKKYIYLGEDNPICHYALSLLGSERFVLPPYIIITDKDISTVKKFDGRDISFLFKVPALHVNLENKQEIIDKIILYSLWL